MSGVELDKKTRVRSFLFFAAGAFAGSGFSNQFVLHVPENGLIALNVPLDPKPMNNRENGLLSHSHWSDVIDERCRLLLPFTRIGNQFFGSSAVEFRTKPALRDKGLRLIDDCVECLPVISAPHTR